mmetsp:Transcript_8207/g.11367  ORF Transcript_8207/g.11367 Transcript_8207/m.11367 type:complete len:97 (-) Transcript_8207:3235-3525(-)
MVEMNAQEMKAFAETFAKQKMDDDQDDKENEHDMFNRPPEATGDPRDRRPTFDLYKVDFKWVEKETSKKELKGAYRALAEDRGFPELLAAVKKKLK